METELSVEIDRPIEQVFDYTLNNVSDWSITCVEDELLEEKPGHVGTTFRMVTEDRGQRMEFHGIITEYDRPYSSTSVLTGKQFDIGVNYSFKDLSGRTRVTQRAVLKGKGFFKVMIFCCGWLMKSSSCKAQQEELNSLKAKCEAL